MTLRRIALAVVSAALSVWIGLEIGNRHVSSPIFLYVVPAVIFVVCVALALRSKEAK